jgi:hypothetical protein
MSRFFNVDINSLTLDELEEIKSIVKDTMTAKNPRENTRRMTDCYRVYQSHVRKMGPAAESLQLKGWTFEQFVSYITKRFPYQSPYEIPICDIFEEEQSHRRKEWIMARQEGRPEQYTELGQPFSYGK